MAQYQYIDVFSILNVTDIRNLGDASDPVLEAVDNPAGLEERDRRRDWPAMTRSVEVVLEGRTQIQAFRDFLTARYGRCVPFWMPTYNHDFRPISASSYELTVRRTELEDGYTHQEGPPATPHQTHRYVYFLMDDGEHYQDIGGVGDGITTDGDTEILTAGSAWPVDDDLLPSYDLCCWMDLVRLDSDQIELNWVSRDLVTAVMPMRLVVPEVKA